MMKETTQPVWHEALTDPSGCRPQKPRALGTTMVIDKGLGLHAFEDLLQTCGAHIDTVKIGFGTSVLYPPEVLSRKIRLAKEAGIVICPGGTFLEVAIAKGAVDDYFAGVRKLGFNGVEISDGTIDVSRPLRNSLISRSRGENLIVFTEYGKKCWGSSLQIDDLIDTVYLDVKLGASLVTIEGRESGEGVGIYDENGDCRDDQIAEVIARIPNRHLLMWEAPQKSQQVHLLNLLGPDIHIGNVGSQDVMSLEALRRGLRSDTFALGSKSTLPV